MRALGLKTTRNAAYQTAYHAVSIPKYRQRVLPEAVADRLRGLPSDVAQAKGFEILALEIQGQVSAETIRCSIARAADLRTRR